MNILITGITSGFGFLTAKQLLKNGHTLLAPVRGGKERLEGDLEFAFALKKGQLFILDIDLSKSAQLAALKQFVDTQFHLRLDALIHNAGIGILMPFELQNASDIRQQFDVNFFTPLELTRLLLPALRFSKGKIICVSSIAGLISLPFYSTYCASKFALEAWAESLSHEVKGHGITVCLIEPGGFKTEFSNRSQEKMKFNIPIDLKDVYTKVFNGFKKMMLVKSSSGRNPKIVVDRIVKMTESSKPQFRNILGIDAWLGYLGARLLPKEFFRKAMGFLFTKVVNHYARDNVRESQ